MFDRLKRLGTAAGVAVAVVVVGTVASMVPAEARPRATGTTAQAPPDACLPTREWVLGEGETFTSSRPGEACAMCLDKVAQPDALAGILNFVVGGETLVRECEESFDRLSATVLWGFGPRDEPPAVDPVAPPARACFGSVRNSPLSDVTVMVVTESGAEYVVAPGMGAVGREADPVVGFRIIDSNVHVKAVYYDLLSTAELDTQEFDVVTPPSEPYAVDLCHEAYLRVRIS